MVEIVGSELKDHPLINLKAGIRGSKGFGEVGENDFPVGQTDAIKNVLGIFQNDPKSVDGGVRHGVRKYHLEWSGWTSTSRMQLQTFFLKADEVLA